MKQSNLEDLLKNNDLRQTSNAFCVVNKMEIKLERLDVSNTVRESKSSGVDCHTR